MAKTPKIYKPGNHKKPTPQELEEEMNKQMAELEEEDTPPKKEEPKKETKETPKVEEEKEDEQPEVKEEVEEPEQSEEQEEPEEDAPPKKETKKPETPKEDKTDWKKRYSDSTTEATILYSKSKKMTDAISRAGEVSEPTEEELKKEYSEWDEMSDTEKRLAKRDLHNTRKLEAITESAKEFKDIDDWSKKVDEYLADPETVGYHPELEGKEEDFKKFATKLSRMGADIEDLVSAFNYSESQKPKITHKGKMFENGSGGTNNKIKPKSDKISVADSRILQKTNYKKYLELLKAGKIETEVD